MMHNEVVFNMQRSVQRFMELQTSMSSGRRINKPSDDPLGTLRDLDYRTELSRIEQYRRNLSKAHSWMTSYDTTLSDVTDLLSETKEIALAMANDTVDSDLRTESASQVKSILDRLVQLTKTQLEGRYMFSGFKTGTSPLALSSNGAEYLGDEGKIQFEIESSIRQVVNTTGAEVFLKSLAVLGSDADINIGVSGGTLLADLNNGNGVDLSDGRFIIRDLNLDGTPPQSKYSTVEFNLAPPVTTMGEAVTRLNNELVAAGMNTTISFSLSDDGNSFFIDTTASGQISTVTKIARLREGNGIDLTQGKIYVTDGAGINVEVDLSSAESVGDIITEFNTQMAAAGVANVTMDVNAAGTGFVINDTNGVPLGLSIQNASADDNTAANLGIQGSVGASLVGEDLNPEPSFEIVEISNTTAADLGILGTYTNDSSGGDLDPALVADSRLADIRNGLGTDGDEFTIWQGDQALTVDLSDPALITVQDLLDYINNSSLDVTASINRSTRAIQIENDDPYKSLIIREEGDQRTARDMGLFGSSDMIGTMLALINTLENDDQEGVELLLGCIDDATTHAINRRASVGSTSMQLEATDSRLVDLNLTFTSMLSEVEDADLAKVITDLATYENSYQAALMAVGKIIQPSLLNFLR